MRSIRTRCRGCGANAAVIAGRASAAVGRTREVWRSAVGSRRTVEYAAGKVGPRDGGGGAHVLAKRTLPSDRRLDPTLCKGHRAQWYDVEDDAKARLAIKRAVLSDIHGSASPRAAGLHIIEAIVFEHRRWMRRVDVHVATAAMRAVIVEGIVDELNGGAVVPKSFTNRRHIHGARLYSGPNHQAATRGGLSHAHRACSVDEVLSDGAILHPKQAALKGNCPARGHGSE